MSAFMSATAASAFLIVLPLRTVPLDEVSFSTQVPCGVRAGSRPEPVQLWRSLSAGRGSCH